MVVLFAKKCIINISINKWGNAADLQEGRPRGELPAKV